LKKEQEKIPIDEEKEQSGEVSRRDFLVGTGTVIVGGAIGAGVLSSCGSGEEVTKTVGQTTTKTVPTTVTAAATTITNTVTTTLGGGATVTQTKTVTQPGGGVEPWQEPEETHYFQLTFH
jgi:hypothetical protein